MLDRERREQSKKEMGGSLMFIGMAIWVADARIAFFFPAGRRLGREGTFLTVIVMLGAMNLALMVTGYQDARRTGRIGAGWALRPASGRH